jgi:hypothetical protein
MRFNFSGYFESSGFELRMHYDINFEDYKYLIFSSKEAQKAIFSFIKVEMQQGEGIKIPNMGKKYIEMTGFYDLFPQKASWEKFKNEVNSMIIYSFEIKNDIVLLTPINIKNNNILLTECGDAILKL